MGVSNEQFTAMINGWLRKFSRLGAEAEIEKMVQEMPRGNRLMLTLRCPICNLETVGGTLANHLYMHHEISLDSIHRIFQFDESLSSMTVDEAEALLRGRLAEEALRE